MAKKKHNDNAFRLRMMQKQKDSGLIQDTYKAQLAMTLYTLHTDFGWGDIRLDRFLKAFNGRLGYYNGDYFEMNDVRDILFEETGIKIE